MAGVVSTVLVLRRGVAKELPDKYEASPDELRESRATTLDTDARSGDDEDAMLVDDSVPGLVLEDSEGVGVMDGANELDDEEASSSEPDSDDSNDGERDPDDPFDMAHYDDEPNDAVLHALASVAHGKDPYLQHGVLNAGEVEDMIINPSDYVIIAGVAEDAEVSHLDVYVLERDQDNLYVHHDYLLPAFPLALAWLDFFVGAPTADDERRASIVAVATFEPYIELWDLDLIDQPAPLAVLGGPSDPSLLGAKRAPLAPDSHTAPVLGLAWNMVQRNLLASASADGKVKVWDLCTGQCVRTLAHHEGKVQAVAWHPSEASLLATGAFDQHIAVLDVRAPDAAVRVSVDADVETLMWMPGNRLLVATESGAVHCFDAASIRKSPKPMWSLQAHTKACHALCLSFNGHVLATGSAERTSPLKVWDLTHMPPLLLEDQTADVGAVLSLAFSPDDPYVLVAGVKGERPAVVDLRHFKSITDKFPETTQASSAAPESTSIALKPKSAKKGKKK